jgi:hypothetical protein
MARKYWEENGYTTEWYYHRNRIRMCLERLSDEELILIVRKHGEKAMAELTMLAKSGNFNNYVGAVERIQEALAKASERAVAHTATMHCQQPQQTDLFS